MTAWAARDRPPVAPPASYRGGFWRGIEDRVLAAPRPVARECVVPAMGRRFSASPGGSRDTRARALFDLCAGFVYSQVLYACVRLRVCDLLLERPRTPEQLADLLSLPLDPAVRLLEAAEALRLVERRRDGRFGVGALGAALAGNPGVAAMVGHHALLYDDLRDPVGLLRGEHERNRTWAVLALRRNRPASRRRSGRCRGIQRAHGRVAGAGRGRRPRGVPVRPPSLPAGSGRRRRRVHRRRRRPPRRHCG